MRKVITLTAQWCDQHEMSDWRQHQYNVRHLKRLMRKAQNKKRSKAQSEQQQQKNAALMVEAHQAYLDVAERYLNKAQATLAQLEHSGYRDQFDVVRKLEIEGFMRHAIRQIDQTKRRVILGEAIPHAEKVFSIFEPHTEWVSKGKAGVPVELGVKVCILEDQHQFILHHQVMQQKTDDQVAVSMVAHAKQRFANLNACSFDKGFHSPANQCALKEQLERVTLPRKGKLSHTAQAEQQSAAFIKARRAHSAIESAINALEVHGLDRCPDHGIAGFKRYVALAVVARNIHRIGAILWQRQQAREQRIRKYSNRAPPEKRVA
jgi:vacuolar-type H+-ATPase subunit E/Vma4